MKLSLNANSGSGGGGNEEARPIAGWFAVGFGLLGIFGPGYIFVPLALLTSVIALFMGQFIWAALGLMLSFAGFVTSPLLWAALGFSALIHWINSIGIPLPGVDV